MLIVIEGPDGAGKTTFIQTLNKALYKLGRWNILISPKASPILPPEVEYMEGLDFYAPGTSRDLILDRSWLSEQVYGPRWRNAKLSDKRLAHLNEWALDRGAIFVYLDAPDEVLVRRVLDERGDDLVTTEAEVTGIADAYRELFGDEVPGLSSTDLVKLVHPFETEEEARWIALLAANADWRAAHPRESKEH